MNLSWSTQKTGGGGVCISQPPLSVREGNRRLIKCLKGQRLRTVLNDNNVEVQDPKGSNCGGGGICGMSPYLHILNLSSSAFSHTLFNFYQYKSVGTCVVDLSVPDRDWAAKPEFESKKLKKFGEKCRFCLLYTSPSPRDATLSRMPSSA